MQGRWGVPGLVQNWHTGNLSLEARKRSKLVKFVSASGPPTNGVPTLPWPGPSGGAFPRCCTRGIFVRTRCPSRNEKSPPCMSGLPKRPYLPREIFLVHLGEVCVSWAHASPCNFRSCGVRVLPEKEGFVCRGKVVVPRPHGVFLHRTLIQVLLMRDDKGHLWGEALCITKKMCPVRTPARGKNLRMRG